MSHVLVLCFQPTVTSILVRFQANDSLRANSRIMNGACRQIQPITRF
jgi:hypothetical protein